MYSLPKQSQRKIYSLRTKMSFGFMILVFLYTVTFFTFEYYEVRENKYDYYTAVCNSKDMIPIYDSHLSEYVCVSGSFIEEKKNLNRLVKNNE